MLHTKVADQIKTHKFRSVSPPPRENRAFYETTWKNTEGPGRPQMIIRRKRIACWIPRAKNTSSEYVILIPFPLQQWLHERASKLRS